MGVGRCLKTQPGVEGQGSSEDDRFEREVRFVASLTGRSRRASWQ